MKQNGTHSSLSPYPGKNSPWLFPNFAILIAMQTMPFSCKIHVISMNSFVSSCP